MNIYRRLQSSRHFFAINFANFEKGEVVVNLANDKNATTLLSATIDFGNII